jgi:flagellar motility protein MotE (MotC chaperone)
LLRLDASLDGLRGVAAPGMSDPAPSIAAYSGFAARTGTRVNFDEISSLRTHSSAWKLLRADNAPLILSFFGKVFVEENIRSISSTDLVSRLDDELYALHERFGEATFPKAAKAYLDDWAAPESGWLRKYYPEGSDDPHFDATPAVEKALSWVKSLQARSFVGTESRLNTIFNLLRQMVFGAETDPDVRLAELRQRRGEIDAEIARVQDGDIEVLDASAQRDRYQQFSATARELLSDFREVEANFRNLDRELRERIAAWHGAKGELLDDILGSRESIADSDQGKSFQAFYDFLLSHAKQEELTELIGRVQALDAIGEPDAQMRHIHYDWLDAGERTQATVRQLSEQLRRFLDDQVWFENRRVIDILRSIEARALELREDRNVAVITEIDGTSASVVLPMERPLYTPMKKAPIDSGSVEAGQDGFDATVLFEQVYVDPARLSLDVRRALQQRSQVGLAQLIRDQPLEHGLAELVTYLSLTDETFRVVFDGAARDAVSWRDPDGRTRTATLPRVTFARTAKPASQNRSQP